MKSYRNQQELMTFYPLMKADETDDTRYAINLQRCGHPEQRYVVSFCGEYVNNKATLKQACECAYWHDRRRMGAGRPNHLVRVVTVTGEKLEQST